MAPLTRLEREKRRLRMSSYSSLSKRDRFMKYWINSDLGKRYGTYPAGEGWYKQEAAWRAWNACENALPKEFIRRCKHLNNRNRELSEKIQSLINGLHDLWEYIRMLEDFRDFPEHEPKKRREVKNLVFDLVS